MDHSLSVDRAALLVIGPLTAREMNKEAKSAGIAEKTLERAKAQLGIRSRKVGRDAGTAHWAWTLPEGSHDDDLGALPQSGSSTGNPRRSPRSSSGDLQRITEYL